MTELSQLICLAALAVALLAVAMCSSLSARIGRSANSEADANAVLQALEAERNGAFFARETRLWDELPAHDPTRGFTNLPEPIRSDAFEVSSHYQTLGYLSEYGYVERDILVIQARYRLLRTWQTITPFVEAERRLRGGSDTFFNEYELLASYAQRLDVRSAAKRLRANAANLWPPTLAVLAGLTGITTGVLGFLAPSGNNHHLWYLIPLAFGLFSGGVGATLLVRQPSTSLADR